VRIGLNLNVRAGSQRRPSAMIRSSSRS
jgi:hypothetical protein